MLLSFAGCSRLVKHLARNASQNTVFAFRKLFSVLAYVLIVLIALPVAGIPITIFAVLGGALAIGVGFGAQNLLNNLISGMILIAERPIRIGDIVELEKERGRVEEIGNRCVRIRRYDGVHVLVPNSYFLEQRVVNWTLVSADIRSVVTVGVAYGSPVEKVRELLLQRQESTSKYPKTTLLRSFLKIRESPGLNVYFGPASTSLWIFVVFSLMCDLRLMVC